MGGCTFMIEAEGKTADEAFRSAVDNASYENGHGGYSGTIAEKDSFVMISCPEDSDPADYADHLIEASDPRVDDKWGPAGCILTFDNRYLFFGWASS